MLSQISIQSLGSDVLVASLASDGDLFVTFFESLGAIIIEFVDAMRARNALLIIC